MPNHQIGWFRAQQMSARVLMALLISMPPAAIAACNEAAEGSASYRNAVARVEALPQYKEWLKRLAEKPGAKATMLPAIDKQSSIASSCYWSVTVYSNEGTHLSRWKTLFVGVGNGSVLAEDTNGQPIPLK
jgi:hypothetical protein